MRTDHAELGAAARASEPYMEHLVIGASDDVNDEDFERRLYMIRKQASHLLRGNLDLTQREMFYICSLSSTVMIYKGMLCTDQLLTYFPDLQDPDYKTHLAMEDIQESIEELKWLRQYFFSDPDYIGSS